MGFLLWDDDVNIYENPHFEKAPLQHIGFFWTNWKEGYENLWIPLTYTVWAVLAESAALPPGDFDTKSGDVARATFDPALFHGTNLLLHLAAVLLVYGILRSLSLSATRGDPGAPGGEKDGLSAGRGAAAAIWPPAIGAALFAVHPLMVEPVAWATGMKDLLAGTLSLAAIGAYLRHMDKVPGNEAGGALKPGSLLLNAGLSFLFLGGLMMFHMRDVVPVAVFAAGVLIWFSAETVRRARISGWYAACTAAYVLALLSKPSAVVVPGIVFVLGVLLKRRPWPRAGFELYPWLWLAGMLTVFTYFAQSGGVFKYEPPPVWFRPFVALDALCFYLVKLVFPVGLGPDYGRSPEWLMAHGAWYVTWVLPCLVGAFALRAWIVKGKPVYIVALSIFLLALLPMLGLIPTAFLGVSAVADRYVYVALLGAVLVVARVLEDHRGNKWLRRGAVVVVAVFAGLTMRQVSFWKNSDILFARTLSVNPNSWLMLYNLGVMATEREQYDLALELFEKAVDLLPWYADAYCNIGTEYARKGDYEKAYDYWRTAVRHQEGHFHALHNLSVNLIKNGRFEEAIEELRKSYRALPYATTRDLIASAYHEKGATLFNGQQYKEAIEYFIKGIEIKENALWRNDLAHAYNNQGVVLLTEGKEKEATPYFQKAVELDGTNKQAKSNLAYNLVNTGQSEEAVRVFQAFLPLFRDDPMYLMSFGVACGDSGMQKEALELIDSALRLNDALPAPDEDLRRRALELREKYESGDAAGNRDAKAGPGVEKAEKSNPISE